MHPRPFLAALLISASCAGPTAVDDTGEAPSCADGFIADASACVPETCGTGTWGNLELETSTIFVDNTAPEGGDGSEASPINSIQPALDLAGSRGGGQVAVAAGTYPETLELFTEHAGVRLTGRCRELVILDASVGDAATPGIDISTRAGEVALSGLTVLESSFAGIAVASGDIRIASARIEASTFGGLAAYAGPLGTVSRVEVTDTEFIDNLGVGVLAEQAPTEVSLAGVTVRGTRTAPGTETGFGLNVWGGARLVAQDCSLIDNAASGISVNGGGTELELVASTIRGSIVDSTGMDGFGINAWDEANVTVQGCDIAGNRSVGVAAHGAGSSMSVRGSTIRDTVPDEHGEFGSGLEASDGAELEVVDSLVVGNVFGGVHTEGHGTRVTLLRTQLTDTQPNPDGEAGFGIDAFEGVVLEASECELRANSAAGLRARGAGTSVAIRDCIIAETTTDGNDSFGYGLEIMEGASASADGCTLERNTTVGVLVTSSSSLTLRDSSVNRTRLGGYPVGYGVQVQSGATLIAEGVEIAENETVGISVFQAGTQAQLIDCAVRDNLPDETGQAGAGIVVAYGAAFAADGLRVVGNHGAGLSAEHAGTHVVLRDSSISETSCDANGDFGYGIQVSDSAQLTAMRCELTSNTNTSIITRDPGTHALLRDSAIAGTTPGYGWQSMTATGASVQQGATLTATGLSIRDTQGPGLYVVAEGSSIDCEACELTANQFAGAAALSGGSLTMRSSTITDTVDQANLGGGVGVFAALQWEEWEWGLPALTLEACTISSSSLAGVWLSGEGAYTLAGNTITDSVGIPHCNGNRCGEGVYASATSAWDGATGLLLEGNTISGNAGAGVLLDDASAQLDQNTWSDNTPDLLVQGASCDELLAEYGDVPTSDICPLWDQPTCDLWFRLDMGVAAIDPGQEVEARLAAPRPAAVPTLVIPSSGWTSRF